MQSNKWDIKENKKVCYIDVDGVLNSYPNCWLDYLREHWEKTTLNPIEIKDLNQVKYKIPYQIYKNLKWEYRESGYKENIEPNPMASTITWHLQQQGYHIVIITSRPVKTHPSLFKQTINWLQKNDIKFDDLIFDEDKHISVLKRYPHLNFGVEDHRYYANLVGSWGYQMYLLDSKYNQGEIHENVMRIDNLIEVAQAINNNKT